MPLLTTISKDNPLPQAMDVKLPKGWFTEDDIRNSDNTAYVGLEDFVNNINNSLSEAAGRVEDLIDALDQQLDIAVTTAYMTINPDASYHVYLLVSEPDYHSTHIQAAHLLAEKFTSENEDLSMRFTFTVKREHIMSYLSSNQYKLKYVHNIERQQRA